MTTEEELHKILDRLLAGYQCPKEALVESKPSVTNELRQENRWNWDQWRKEHHEH